MASDAEHIEALSKIFQEGLDLFNNLDKTDEPMNNPNVQMNVKKAMGLLEKATQLASIAGMFSTNESIEEIATNDIQYMLLPALLGTLSLKLTSGERKEIVDVAEIYFKDFLQRCNDYALSDYVFKDQQTNSDEKKTSETEKIQGMVLTRHNKIQRFKQEKELQAKLADLKKNLGNTNADDEIKREYMLTMIKLYIYKAIEELDSINMEKPILAHMQKLKENEGTSKHVERLPPKPKPLKPIILTKDAVQKAVFGLGYPSLPTMTVKEFYDQRVKEGIFPDPSKVSTVPKSLQEAALAGVDTSQQEEAEDIRKEQQIEEDDPELLQRMRDQDEHKDDHRRGWGNRMNRS